VDPYLSDATGFPPRFERAMRLHADTPEHERLVSRAVRSIRAALAAHSPAYAAFSGGKDSTVLADLFRRAGGRTYFHWDYGPDLMPREVEREILSNLREVAGPDAVVIVRGRPPGGDCAVGYRAFYGTLRALSADLGWRAGFVGLRAEESCSRASRTAAAAGPGGEVNRGQGVRLFFPLADWSWRDVYAHVISRGLPIPRVYHRLAALVGYEEARLVTFFDPEFEHLGGSALDGHAVPGFKHSRGWGRPWGSS